MIITVASGKGGTGKTTFAVNLAYALAKQGEGVRLLDCDVEEPNDHLFVQPQFTETSEVTVPKPVWNEEKCTGCGECAQACNYNAIAVVKGRALIFNEVCHSCGLCSYVCPEKALHEAPSLIGVVQSAPRNQPFFFAHGLLNIGESLAPKVVQAVKGHIHPDSINILDASPGTACPVVKALEGTDVAVLITEPTPFGLNDLKLAVAMTLKMGIPTGIVINRSDGEDRIITDWTDSVNVPIVGRIPFERKYAETYSRGNILIHEHAELEPNLLEIYKALCTLDKPASPLTSEQESAALTPMPATAFEKGQDLDHREVVIISGKGGTGKTTITGSFAVLSQKQVLADNDVDAADLHLLLAPRVREVHPFVGGTKSSVDSLACIGCGRCAEACHFDALRLNGPANAVADKTWQVDPVSCEGCGFCIRICPVKAIWEEETITGTWYVSETDCGPMVHARLGIAEENSGRLVTQVRNHAGALAKQLEIGRILGDGPPGTGCPVIASISGCDLALIVTEPTVSGVHDMKRVLDLTAHFGIPALIIINKADLNANQAEEIIRIAEEQQSRVIAKIPFDKTVNDALTAGKTVVQHGQGTASHAIKEAWQKVQQELEALT
ncbi:MAG: ATP-binding protein [Kiritimatiellae bacterium]|nr:ATP-binding protein [Kiritimatiellia bacterium]